MNNTKFKSLILLLFSVLTCCCQLANGQDEVTSAGNKTVYIRWTVSESTKASIVCKPEGTPAPTLKWFLNVDDTFEALPDVGDKMKYFKEPDGSVALQFNAVSYDIINAFGAAKDYSIAVYTCVATGENLPTNYTNCVIFVQEYRSGGTVTLAVFLLLGFLAFATFISWKLHFNHKAIQAVPD